MTSIEIKERIVVLAAGANVPRLPCPVCTESTMVTPEEAAALARVTVRNIYARVEADSVHFLEMPDGLLLLCATSLTQRARFGELKKLICATNPDDETQGEGLRE